MKAIVKLFILLLVLVNITKAQVILPMGNGQKNSLNISCSYGDKMWVVSNENEKFVINKWDGDFWISYPEIPVSLLNIISTIPQSIIAKSVFYDNNILYLALSNKYNEKLLLLKNSGKNWEEIKTENTKVSNNLTFLSTSDGLLLCGKISVDNQLITILKVGNSTCTTYAGLSANQGSNDFYTDFEYHNNTVWAIGFFTSSMGESRYFAKLDNGNWKIITQAPFVNGNIAIGKYDQKLIMAGVDFDGKLAISNQKPDSSWAEISNGLSNWKINSISDFRQIGKNFWAAGQFTNIFTNTLASLAFWNGTTWNVPNFDFIGNDILLNGQNQVLISGNLIQYQGLILNHTGILDFGNAVIAGKIFNDLNKNCTQENGENNIVGAVVKLMPEKIFISSDLNGRYYFPIDSSVAKQHLIEIQIPKYQQATCGSIKPAILSSRLTISDINFGLINNGSHIDAAVTTSDFTGWRARQGFDENYLICVQNKGTQKIETGKLSFKWDARLGSWDFDKQPDFLNNNSAEWTIDNLFVSQSFCIKGKTTIPLNLALESEILFDAKILIGDLQDEDASNNIHVLKQKIVAAIDPNDKNTRQPYFIAPTQNVIDYKIRFQNTGNAAAKDIVIKDTIDPNLAFGILGSRDNSSHIDKMFPSIICWRQANGNYQYKLNWLFKDINLPDSTTNEPASHGFIDYTMNLSTNTTLPIGTKIRNQAYIYFDFQEPILTNVARNMVSLSGQVKAGVPAKTFGIYPNPAREFINIIPSGSERINIKMVNYLGQTIFAKSIEPHEKEIISISHFSKGIYLIIAEGYSPIKLLID